MDSHDLTLIDAGITSLSKDVVIPPELRSLNLHCNFIKTIENVQNSVSLIHLDLSSNQIKIIENLDSLINLRTLNLSTNQIVKVQRLGSLRNLEHLNLSFNLIQDISGFVGMSDHKLERVDLQGNRIRSQQSVIDAFRNCKSLRKLILCAGGAENPVCHSKNYRVNLLSSLTQLTVFDWTDRAGNVLSNHGSEVPGLDEFLSQILSSSSSDTVVAIETPAIDDVIDNFKQRRQSPQFSESTELEKKHEEVSKVEEKQPNAMKQEELNRLRGIESQLSRLLELKENQTPKRERVDNEAEKYKKKRETAVTRSKTPLRRRPLTSKQASVSAEDETTREELKITYQHLVEDLNNERERRFKAEHAAKQLTERLKELQLESQLTNEKQGIAIGASTKLKEYLGVARKEIQTLSDENQNLKEELQNVYDRLQQSKEAHESTVLAMKSMQESVAKIDSEKCQTTAHYTKMLHDADAKVAAAQREIDLLRVQVKEQKSSINQLQQLVASREQQHRDELDQRYTLNSPEIQELLQKEARSTEALYQNTVSTLRKELDNANIRYTELEDEFRAALHIEANRYNKLHDAYAKVSEEAKEQRHELMTLKHKEEKNSQIASELTQLVKDQKVKIAELAKSKHDRVIDLKDRIQTLESNVDEARRRLVQHELLKQEKKRLEAQLNAQDSVIEGLRQERKLWGQELAQQGSSLAQDRGRLESKIETLTLEISHLKKQLDKEVDAVKIKTKLIDDQTESIRRLKEALVERDAQVKSARDETLDVQKKLENELLDEKRSFQEAQTMIECLTDRKEELKEKVEELTIELENERENNANINNKWSEKADAIKHLESQVFTMKEHWEKKEKDLIEDKEKAMKAATMAIEKMRKMDNAFRKQLENAERSHQEDLKRVVRQKEAQLKDATDRVEQVENEMRELLKDQADGKRQADETIKKMGQAFIELQQVYLQK